MRIKNKEIRRRRHRKEQIMKAADRALRIQYADKDGSKKVAAPAKKAPAKKKAE